MHKANDDINYQRENEFIGVDYFSYLNENGGSNSYLRHTSVYDILRRTNETFISNQYDIETYYNGEINARNK